MTTPNRTPKIGYFTPNIRASENFGVPRSTPKIQPPNFGVDFGEMAENRHFLASHAPRAPRVRARISLRDIGYPGPIFGAPRSYTPKTTPKLGPLASLRPNFGVQRMFGVVLHG